MLTTLISSIDYNYYIIITVINAKCYKDVHIIIQFLFKMFLFIYSYLIFKFYLTSTVLKVNVYITQLSLYTNQIDLYVYLVIVTCYN